MDPQISIEAEFKDGKLHTGMERAVRSEEKMEEGLKKIAKQAAAAEKELERFAKRTTEINSTPAEKYAAAVKRADDALKAGKISQEIYNRELVRQKSLLDATQQAMQNVGRQQQQSMGENFLGQVKALAGGYFTLQTAVNLVADAFRHAKQESQAALASLRSLDDANRRLNQIAGSPAELDAMMQRADAAAEKFGVDRAVARDTLFQTFNYGNPQDFEQIMAASALVAPQEGARVGGKMAAMFQGQVSPMQALNMTIRAAKSSEMDVEQFASTMAIAGEGGRIAGAGADETMAAVAVLSSAFKSGQVGADRVKTFMTKTGLDSRFAGKGLLGSLDALQAMNPEERAGFLKSDMEINAAYQALTQFEGQIRTQQAAIAEAGAAAGTSRSEISKGIGRASQSGAMQASLQARRGEIGLAVDREAALAGDEARRGAAVAGVQSAGYRSGLGVFGQFGASMIGGLGSMLQLPDEASGVLALGGAAAGRGVAAGVLGPLAGLMQELTFDSAKFHKEALAELRAISGNTTRNPAATINQRASQRAQ
jgi:hypothetical protein